jgi:hypothetical protein
MSTGRVSSCVLAKLSEKRKAKSETSCAAGNGLGTTIKYLRCAAINGLVATTKYLRNTTSGTAGNGLGIKAEYL